MTNTLASYPLPVNPAITTLKGGQALSFKTVSGELTLTPYSATDTDYAGFYNAMNGTQDIDGDLLAGKISYCPSGFFRVPVAPTNVVKGNPLYVDATTGFFTNVIPTTGYVKQVGRALTASSANEKYVEAEMLKMY